MSGTDYEAYTREHYRSPAVAATYARRLRPWRNPPEWVIGQLEKIALRRCLRAVSAKERVLDVPAGTGKLTRSLLRRFRLYVAGDVSADMLGQLNGSRVKAQMDVTRLPFRGGATDVVVVLRLLHRVPVTVVTDALREALRVGATATLVSYTAAPRNPGLYRWLQRLGRRPTKWTTVFTPASFAELVASCGGYVEKDVSISARITTERVALLRPRAAEER